MVSVRTIIAAAAANLLAFTAANAALISPTSSATAAVDLSSYVGDQVSSIGYSCYTSCNTDPSLLFQVGKQFSISGGTTPGASDVFSTSITNNFANDVNNLTFYPSVAITPSLTTLYLTLAYVDDLMGVDGFSIGISDANGNFIKSFGVSASQLDLKPVPLPAALPLFLAGLAGMGAASRRRKPIPA